MRQLILTTLCLILLVVITLIHTQASLTTAQDNGQPTPTPPEAEATMAATAPDSEPLVVGLPFTDTFDNNINWRPSGAWRFDTLTAYEGAGWFLDVSQRNQVSILSYQPFLDLSGTFSAQLLFRQNGYLPPTDFVAVDVSVNGGDSWIMIDQQIGIGTEWEQHIVDLTQFRGQVVRLRFRAQTGESQQIVQSGYWIDNLTIQFVMTLPEVVYAPVDPVPKSLMGLHLIVGAQREPILDLAHRLRAVGRPLGTLKGTSGTEDILAAVKAISPETVTIFRSLETDHGMRDCPNAGNPPEAEARAWLNSLQPYWSGIQADYFEIMNECGLPVEWLVPFGIEAMKAANERGQCLLLYSFAPGRPEPEAFAALEPVFEYALQNPCRSGRMHGIALHAYGVNPGTLVSESGIYLGFRHRLLMATVLDNLPEAILVPIYITEAGPGDGRAAFACQEVARDVVQYTGQLEFDPYVRSFMLWNVGPNDNWFDVAECLPLIGDVLTNYYANHP